MCVCVCAGATGTSIYHCPYLFNSRCSPVAVSLLKSMLEFDPLNRTTVADSLGHPFFARYKDSPPQPTATPFSFDFDVSLCVFVVTISTFSIWLFFI